MSVGITFINYSDERLQELDNRFDYIQVTYDLLRGWKDGTDTDLAFWSERESRWIHDGVEYTDFSIGEWK